LVLVSNKTTKAGKVSKSQENKTKKRKTEILFSVTILKDF